MSGVSQDSKEGVAERIAAIEAALDLGDDGYAAWCARYTQANAVNVGKDMRWLLSQLHAVVAERDGLREAAKHQQRPRSYWSCNRCGYTPEAP